MFLDLNIKYYIMYMKREFFGGFLFIGLVFGVNYVLKNVLKEFNDEDDVKQESTSSNNVVDELLMEELCDQAQADQVQADQVQADQRADQVQADQRADQVQADQVNPGTIELLDSVIPMVSVLETKIRDDIDVVQKILERKKYLVNLNEKLVEIKDKLQGLKNELTKD